MFCKCGYNLFILFLKYIHNLFVRLVYVVELFLMMKLIDFLRDKEVSKHQVADAINKPLFNRLLCFFDWPIVSDDPTIFLLYYAYQIVGKCEKEIQF